MSELSREPSDGTIEQQAPSSDVYEIPPCEAGENCHLPTDIVLRSCDGVRFGAHTRNLELYSDGFPKADSVMLTRDDVELQEESDVVILLLKFMHHQPQPDLSLLASKLLIKFANAAEKYAVYSATGVCKLMVDLSVNDQPFDAFLYARKHGYTSMLDKAGKLAVAQEPAKFFAYTHSIGDVTWRDLAEAEIHNLSTTEVWDALRQYPDWPPIFGAWFRKREAFREAIFKVLKSPIPVFHKGGQKHCDEWHIFYENVLMNMGTAIPSEKSFLRVVENATPLLEGCSHCAIVVKSMKSVMHYDLAIIQGKSLTSFLE
ncbi:hypothetical protein GYMLUDRAFT_49167 [Collybiopsis luxurians FD-317 M1]|uniref:BTB domain-containing protein n=1 Tax=Collybiopsis luxurians FD-317 M1 TaxID=944289 RepID=A0A0D0CFZ2_9AGAR|nr:hypothetical protein GYMLUDRAFT_49167 [Collybiopsis luxurians FD-317 M1]